MNVHTASQPLAWSRMSSLSCTMLLRAGLVLGVIAGPLMQPVHAADDIAVVELTPVGAERAGNKDGSIPPWDGGLQQAPKAWTIDRGYIDPFPKDAPQLIISAQNMEAHKAKLSQGLQALLSAHPESFRIPVYATRRTAALPATVLATAQKEAPGIKISGDALLGRTSSVIPFPTPQSGEEVMWNHRLRYRGGVVEYSDFWYPVRDGKLGARTGMVTQLAENANLDTPTPNGIFFIRSRAIMPATLAHTENLIHETVDASEDSRNWWVINDAQRRYRRLSNAGYDDMGVGTDDLRTRDQADGFNGALNRYEWKLLGKKEMLVPYNIFKLNDKRLNPEHVLGTYSVKPDFMRYELHRVWVVEATLKPSMRHIYGKRTFYVDEDSWQVLLEDAYDTRGKLWRVGVHGQTQFYDAQVPGYGVNIWHDLSNGAYLMSGVDMEAKTPRKFSNKASLADFKPERVNNKEAVK